MSLTITTKPKVAKPKLKTAAKAKPLPSDTEKLVDQIVEQNPAILAAKEPKKLQDSARKELLELVEPTADPHEEIIVKGTKGQVRFSPCADKRYVVDPQTVHKLLGDEAFYAIIDVRLGELDKYLTKHQLEQVVAKGTGSRSMTVLPLDA